MGPLNGLKIIEVSAIKFAGSAQRLMCCSVS
jgi:hypothetical protein